MPAKQPPQRIWRNVIKLLSDFILLLLVSIVSTSLLAQTSHPFDPLTEQEIKTAAQIIAASGKLEQGARASTITLDEPDKHQVLNWKSGKTIPRKAFAVLRMSSKTIEIIVDLDTQTIESWALIPGAQPAILSAEWAEAEKLVKHDPRWQAAMLARGYESYEHIFCDSLSTGNFGRPEESSTRLIKMPCYDIGNSQTNVYSKPIEGLITTVNLDANVVMNVLDEGVVSGNTKTHEFDEDSIDALRTSMHPVRNTAPDGWNFQTEGRMISWQGWSFHLGFNQRFGPVLSLVQIEDRGKPRSVLYQANVSEVFVPYMEPSASWSFRNYMDAGEYGLGTLSSKLTPGIDCPSNAKFFDASISTASGGAYQRKQVMCVFERDPVEPLWRHAEALNGSYEGRPATELVVRSIPSIAHYDYVIDWVFSQSGMIEVKIGATGIDAVKAVAVDSMDDSQAGHLTQHGTLVAPGLVAINHDHFFSIRLDFDVDGQTNRFVRERLSPVNLADNPRRSLWQIVEDPMTKEGAVSANHGPQIWSIENTTVKTGLGHHPSYQIQGHGPTSLLDAEDWPQRRAAFSAHNLWITTQHKNELFAAGAYPNQSQGGGLPEFVSGENIDQNDIVAWYTIGFHHVTRPEDWPILSTLWQSVKLRPYRFFTQNPSLGVRRNFAGETADSE